MADFDLTGENILINPTEDVEEVPEGWGLVVGKADEPTTKKLNPDALIPKWG
jgi:hypothetical protein